MAWGGRWMGGWGGGWTGDGEEDPPVTNLIATGIRKAVRYTAGKRKQKPSNSQSD